MFMGLLAFMDVWEYQTTLKWVILEVTQISNNIVVGQKDITYHKYMLQVPIKKPIFIISLPRTGSTIMNWLFNCDPMIRCPTSTEMHMSTSPGPMVNML